MSVSTSATDLDNLIGREVEVFWPEEEEWYSGTVAEKGEAFEPATHEDGEDGVGWLIKYDDGEEGWVSKLRGNALVRFLGSSVSISRRDNTNASAGFTASLESLGSGEGEEALQPGFQAQTFASVGGWVGWLGGLVGEWTCMQNVCVCT